MMETMKCNNKVTLGYTMYDDGVWVFCRRDNVYDPIKYCGFEKNLGFKATVDDVITAQKEHDEREHDKIEG